MAQKSYSCGDAPLLTIQTEGNISIRAGARSDILVTIEDLEDIIVTETNNGLSIVCDDDCVLDVPENSNVAVDGVGGNVSVADLKGNLYLSQIDGNVSLTNIRDAAIKKIDGNCRLDGAVSVTIEKLDGNLKGSQVTGPLTADRVDGNIKIGSVGNIKKLNAAGNIEVGIHEITEDVDISADGNIYLDLPEDPNFVLDAAADGNISSQFGGEIRRFNGAVQGIIFGAGGPKVKLAADGNITLANSLGKTGSSGYGPGGDVFESENWRKMNERIQKRIEARTMKAERRAMAIQRKAMKRVRDAMKSVEGFDYERVIDESLRSAGWPFTDSEAASAVANEPFKEEQPEEREKVTDAERMLVLDMLREKKITAEEAERLLDALEGKFHNEQEQG